MAFSAFKKFCALAENESGKKVRVFRTDRGGEYGSKMFTEYCETTGIE